MSFKVPGSFLAVLVATFAKKCLVLFKNLVSFSSAEVHRFDLHITNGTWRAMASMVNARARFSSVVNGDQEIFVFPDSGSQWGGASTDTIEVYDIEANSWTIVVESGFWAATAVKLGETAWIYAMVPIPQALWANKHRGTR